MGLPYNPLYAVVKEGLLRVYPDECLVCHREGLWICASCIQRFVAIKSPTCPFCNRLSTTGSTCRRCVAKYHLNGNRSLWYYHDAVKSLIHRYKYQGITAPTNELVAHLAQLLPLLPRTFHVVTCVPSLPAKWRERGFNQSQLLGTGVARITNLPFRRLLNRYSTDHTQVGLSRAERFANVANQFSCHARLNKESVLIIDDVITTGATLNACAKALKDAGSGPVWAITLAKD